MHSFLTLVHYVGLRIRSKWAQKSMAVFNYLDQVYVTLFPV
jgi:hypothetical protein